MKTYGITDNWVRKLLKTLPARVAWARTRPLDSDPMVYAILVSHFDRDADNPEIRYIIEGCVDADEGLDDGELWCTFTAYDNLFRKFIPGISLDKLYQHGWVRVMDIELPQPLSKVCKTYRPSRTRKAGNS